MELREDDRVRAVDVTGAIAPLNGTVIKVSAFYAIIWYDLADRERIHWGDKADGYYLSSGWRAWDGEMRWRLQLIRLCWRCKHDISGPGQAHPALWKAMERGETAWQCGDEIACIARQDDIDEQLGLEPLDGIWDWPIAMLEAAS